MNALVSDDKKKHLNEIIIERSKMLYGFTPAEKSDQNENWMLLNGYLKKKKLKRTNRGRR